MCGITLSTYNHWRREHGAEATDAEGLRKITKEEWINIFASCYWKPWHAERINNQSVADLLVDFGFNSGTACAIGAIQRHVLHVHSDGICGRNTLEALNNAADQEQLHRQIKQCRLEFYENIVKRNNTQKVFLPGWKRRLEKFCYKA